MRVAGAKQGPCRSALHRARPRSRHALCPRRSARADAGRSNYAECSRDLHRKSRPGPTGHTVAIRPRRVLPLRRIHVRPAPQAWTRTRRKPASSSNGSPHRDLPDAQSRSGRGVFCPCAEYTFGQRPKPVILTGRNPASRSGRSGHQDQPKADHWPKLKANVRYVCGARHLIKPEARVGFRCKRSFDTAASAGHQAPQVLSGLSQTPRWSRGNRGIGFVCWHTIRTFRKCTSGKRRSAPTVQVAGFLSVTPRSQPCARL